MSNELQQDYNGSGTLYAVIRRYSDNYVWSVASGAFVTWSDGSIGDYDVALTSRGGDLYTADFPTGITAGTRVRVVFYEQAGVSPATTDLLLRSLDVTWDGSGVSSGSSVTLDSTALTTLNAVKRHLNISDTAKDTILTELINAMSARIKRECGRDFVATDYREWHTPDGSTIIAERFPALFVNAVAAGDRTGLTAQYTGTDKVATVQVTDTLVRLQSTAADGTTTSTSLTFATYPTLSTMATAIAAVSGWTCTADTADGRSGYLHPVSGRSALQQQQLTYADDLLSEYRVDITRGILVVQLFTGTLNSGIGWRSVLLDYRAGYDTIPADVDWACRELVASAYRQASSAGIQTESLGDYSYTLASGAELSSRVASVIAPYRRFAVG